MKELPTEVLLTFDKYLNQQEKKTCTLVCRHWYNAFSRLVFSKAVLLTRSQVTGFLQQNNTKKQMTTSLHLIEAISNKEFKNFIDSCPKVKDLTLFINFTHRLDIPATVSLITRNWGAHLTKIRMDSLLLTEILPLLSHQLIDVTGDFGDLIVGGTGTGLIPMPKLKVLSIESIEYEDTGTMFSRLREAYSDLTTLTVTGATFEYPEEDYSALVPFPKLRSFHLVNCDQITDSFLTNVLRLIRNLDSFSNLRSGFSEYPLDCQIKSLCRVVPHANPRLRDMKLDYTYSGDRENLRYMLDPLSSLAQLRSLHIELRCELSDVSFRERVSLLEIITALPHLRNLTIYGLAHLETVDGLADYLVGKVGFYDSCINMVESEISVSENESANEVENTSIRLRKEGLIDYCHRHDDEENPYEEGTTSYIDHHSRYSYKRERDRVVWGAGEILTDRRAHIMVCRKKYPRVNVPNETSVTWDTSPSFVYNSRFDDHSDFVSDLTVLRFEMATLRNQSYRWINGHCPLLTELHVLQTDIYPWCEIYLADLKHLHTFNWSLERYYEPYLWPVFQITEKNKTCVLKWDYESKTYKKTSDAHCLLPYFYKVILTLPPSLSNFTVNDYKINLFSMD